MIAIRVENLRKAFPGTQALDGCSLAFHTGECHGLVGENGAGKSTLMKILAGAERADSGAAELMGRPMAFRDPRQGRAAGISAIYQELELIPELSVAENVFLGREPRRRGGLLDRPRIRAEARRRMRDLGREIDPALPVSRLNLAEKQLVEIARALEAESRVFLMDEPTAALGDRDRAGLFSVIRRLTAAGAAVVFVSHRLEEVLEICDRVTVMRDGRDVLSAPASELTKDRLIVAMAGETEVQGRRRGDSKVQGPTVAGSANSQQKSPPSGPLLETRNLSTATGLSGISLSVARGEIVVLTGLAGSGRTRLLRALFGADPLAGGEILLDSRGVRPRSPAEAAALGIGFLGEERRVDGLISELGVRSNVSLPSLERFRTAFRLLSRSKESEAVAGQVSAVGVRAASLETPVRLLSGGNQQKALLARWLLARSRVLLLDEPTRGVDINGKNEIYRLLRRQAQGGLGLLMTTSELPEALLLADRILVMRNGRIAGDLPRADAEPERILRLAVGEN
jgi:ABC-type sugar transport system ATPase subunit